MSLYVDIKKNLGSFVLETKFEADGGVTGILGASGCGKSMTLRCIAGILKPDAGRIELDGRVFFDSEKIDKWLFSPFQELSNPCLKCKRLPVCMGG